MGFGVSAFKFRSGTDEVRSQIVLQAKPQAKPASSGTPETAVSLLSVDECKPISVSSVRTFMHAGINLSNLTFLVPRRG